MPHDRRRSAYRPRTVIAAATIVAALGLVTPLGRSALAGSPVPLQARSYMVATVPAGLQAGQGGGSGFCGSISGMVNGQLVRGYNLGPSFDNVYACGPTENMSWSNDPIESDFQCVELSARFLWDIYGLSAASANGNSFVANNHSRFPSIGVGTPASGSIPVPGDIVSLAGGAQNPNADPFGHTAVVSDISHMNMATGNGYIVVIEENDGGVGTGVINVSNWTESYGNPQYLNGLFWYTDVSWLELAGSSGPPGYLAAADGHVYPYGSAALVSEQTVWPTQATAKAIAIIPNTRSGYVLDGFGGLHAFGGAPRLRPSAYWFGQDMARALALTPSGTGGYVLDAYGGLHAFGAAAPLTTTAYWPGWDIARALVLRGDGLGGWILDGWGGMHSFGAVPNVRLNAPYFPGHDMVRSACLRSDGDSGWWVDGANDLHSFGGAPAATSSVDFPGQDVAVSITCADNGGGYTLTRSGRLLPFGDAVAVWPIPQLSTAAGGMAAG